MDTTIMTGEEPSMELVETGAKYDVKGRRLIPAVERAAFLAAYDRSGLTQAAFARREGIKYSTFACWVQERRVGQKRKKSAPKMRFEEVRLPAQGVRDGLEVRLPDGMVIRGASAREVAELLQALRV